MFSKKLHQKRNKKKYNLHKKAKNYPLNQNLQKKLFKLNLKLSTNKLLQQNRIYLQTKCNNKKK